MTAEWNRDEALRLAERIDIGRHTGVPQGGWVKAALASADLLRAADAEIARLRARVEAAEQMAEALRFYDTSENWRLNGPLDGNSPNFTGGPASTALAAWDASRGDG